MKNRGGDYTLIVATVAFAFVLWYGAFAVDRGNFWIKISLSATALASIAVFFDRSFYRTIRFDMSSIVLGIVSAVLLYLIFYLGKQVSGLLFAVSPDQISHIYDKGMGTHRWIIALLLLLVTGPAEELFWRGFLQRRLSARLGDLTGLVIATACYAGVHLSSGNFMLIGAAAVAGAFWGIMYYRFGRLGPIIISHSIWSAVIFAFLPMQ